MRKFILSLAFIILYVYDMNAQQTPAQVLNYWQYRYVPNQAEVDSTFSSIVFKTEKDSFAYSSYNGYQFSTDYGDGTMDTTVITTEPVQDKNNLTYIATRFNAGNNVGFPAYSACYNTITINTANNSYFDPSDTITVTLKFNAYTPAGGSGIDTMAVDIYASTTDVAGVSTRVKKRINNPDDTWGSYSVTLQIPAPVNSSVQTIFIVFEPKFGAKGDTASIANVKAKISN